MLNLWIGLCKGVPGLPHEIADLSYRVHAIEPMITSPPPNKETCNPELIIASEPMCHSALFEWKEGPNTNADQLGRYSRVVTSVQLQRMEFMSVQATKAFDIVIIGPADHVERLKIGIERGGYTFPLLVVDEKGIHRVLNEFKCPGLNAIFNRSLGVDFNRAPYNFVPFDAQSELWEVADAVIPKVMDAIHERKAYVKAETIAKECCTAVWDALHKKGKGDVRTRVCDVLREAAASEFSGYLKWKQIANDCAVEVIDNPITYQSDKRLHGYKRMQKTFQDFKARLASGRPFHGQLPLFT